MLVLTWEYRPIDDGRPVQRGTVELDLATHPSPSVQADGIAGRGRHQVWLQRDYDLKMDHSVRLATAAGGENWTGAGTTDLAAGPCPSVQAHGLGGSAKHQHWLERGDRDPRAGLDHRQCLAAAQQSPTPDHTRPDLDTLEADTQERQAVATETGKPPYRPPTMDEIRAVPWNGLNVVTTFAGGGGSSAGYRMSGYRILAAVEFVPAAQDTYAANMAEYTHLFRRDVRDVTAADILKATGLKKGQLDLFDGSPPCEPFSSAGQRDKKWGQVNPYSGQMQRSDDLFLVYAHLLAELQPKTFVAENVAGLVKGRAKGYFKIIHKVLGDAGYQVEARLLDAQWLGVPQTRQRLIFVGVRNDLAQRGLAPAFPTPLPYRYTVRDALPWIFRVGTAPHHGRRKAQGMSTDDMMVEADTRPAPGIRTTSGHAQVVDGTTGADGVVDAQPGSGDRVVHQVDHGQFASAGDITERPAPTVQARRQASEDFSVERDSSIRTVLDDQHGQQRRANRNRTLRDTTDQPHPTVVAGDGQTAKIAVERDVDLADVVAGDRVVNDPETGRPPERARPIRDVTDTVAPTILAGSDSSAPQSRQLGPERDIDLADLIGDRAVAGSFATYIDQNDVTDQPVPAILTGSQEHQGVERDLPQGARQHAASNNGWRIVQLADGRVVERRKFTISELKAICGFPPDYQILGSFSVQWERLGDTHAPLQVHHLANAIRDEILIPNQRRTRTKPYDITQHLPRLAKTRAKLQAAPATSNPDTKD